MKRHRHGGSGSTPMAQFSIIFDCSSSHYLNNQIILLNCCFVHLYTSSSTVRAVARQFVTMPFIAFATALAPNEIEQPRLFASALRSAVPCLYALPCFDSCLLVSVVVRSAVPCCDCFGFGFAYITRMSIADIAMNPVFALVKQTLARFAPAERALTQDLRVFYRHGAHTPFPQTRATTNRSCIDLSVKPRTIRLHFSSLR